MRAMAAAAAAGRVAAAEDGTGDAGGNERPPAELIAVLDFLVELLCMVGLVRAASFRRGSFSRGSRVALLSTPFFRLDIRRRKG